MRFLDQVVVIGGAAGGIGSATARRFLQEGATLGLLDRDDGVHALERSLSGEASQILCLSCDVTNDALVAESIDSIVKRFGRIDVVFNSFGGSVPEDRPIDEADLEVWRKTLQLDLGGTFSVCRHVLPYMKRQRRGVIVNMASGAALRGSSASHAYTAAKGGVVSLTRVIAGTYAQHGVRANAICAGRVNTERIRRSYGVPGAPGSVVDPMDGEAQFKKYPFWFGQPDDIANIVLFLASDESRMITGSAIEADGGRSAY